MRGPQRRCFYASSPTGQLMAVDITTQPTFQQGTPRVVLEEGFRLVAGTQGANDDVSLDGQPNIKPDEGLVGVTLKPRRPGLPLR